MEASERGTKHTCLECASKYYDFGKEVTACPSCGAKPVVPKPRKPGQQIRRSGRAGFGRFP